MAKKYSTALSVERDLKRLILQTSHGAIFRLKSPILDVKGGKCINGLTVTSKVIQVEIIWYIPTLPYTLTPINSKLRNRWRATLGSLSITLSSGRESGRKMLNIHWRKTRFWSHSTKHILCHFLLLQPWTERPKRNLLNPHVCTFLH